MKRSWIRNLICTTCLATAIVSVGTASAQSVRRITLRECIDLAMRQNPDVTASASEIDAAEAQRLSARGNYGPRLNVNAGVQVWDKAVPMNLGAMFGPVLDLMKSAQGVNGDAADQIKAGLNKPLIVRDSLTWSAGATLAQPIGALWTIHEGSKLRAIGVNVAKIHDDTVRRDTAYQVIESYYRVLQAKRLEEITAKSVEQIEAQVKRSDAFYRQGTVGKNDVLRAQLGLAAAKQRQIQASGMVTLAQGRLGMLLGMPTGTTLEPATAPTEPPPRTLLNVQQAEAMATSRRVELTEVDTRIKQAEGSVDLAKSKMLPQINAVASYAHNEGSAFNPKNAVFVGGTLSWDIWENGATYYGISEAKAKLAQAMAVRKKVEDGLRLEARNAFVNASTAAEALVVAQSAVTQAEENFRIESKRYEAANNTSFDVLDAETLLTNTRGQHQAALYDYIIAQAALSRATGEPPAEPRAGSTSEPQVAPAAPAAPVGPAAGPGAPAPSPSGAIAPSPALPSSPSPAGQPVPKAGLAAKMGGSGQ